MKIYTASQWIMFFFIYCFLGWVWESAYVSLKEKQFVNRGFMKGPVLPIYGSGAICVLFATLPFRGNLPLMSLAGMVAAAVLEYVTGYVMERLFHVRYWDYTGRFLSLNGYICFASVACWAVMTLLVTEVIQVYLERIVLAVDESYITVAVLVITPIMTADFVTSFITAMRLRDVLIRNERLQQELQKLAERKQELEEILLENREKAKEWMEEAEDKAKDVGVRAKDQVFCAGGKARDLGIRAKDQVVYTGEKAAAELHELVEKMGELKGQMKVPSAGSIRDLLRRNPSAVSHQHTETFAQFKDSLTERFNNKSDHIEG